MCVCICVTMWYVGLHIYVRACMYGVTFVYPIIQVVVIVGTKA